MEDMMAENLPIHLWDRLQRHLTWAWTYYKVEERFEASRQYALDHPVIALIAICVLAVSCIPVICFIGFVFGSIIFTLIGFLVVEGILLAVGSVILGSILWVVIFFALMVGVSVAAVWCTYTRGRLLLRGACHKLQQRYCNTTGTDHDNPEVAKDKGQEKTD